MQLSKKEKSNLLKRLAEDKGLEFKPEYSSKCGTYQGPALVTNDVSDAVFATMAFAQFKIKLRWDDVDTRRKVIYF